MTQHPYPSEQGASVAVRSPARWHAAACMAALMTLSTGCAVQRGQETMGAYIDDTGITTGVKSRFFDSRAVDGTAISVETLNGTVMLSGFAKSNAERNTAESLAREVKGVKAVKNEIAVRP
jgi:hyperosmotically inducible protein